MSLFSWLRPISEAETRTEIWHLGTRHHGRPLEGAQAELDAGDLTPERASLLRACISRLRRS